MGILYPFKRVYGLIGAPRSGKDLIANFLVETRGFTKIAFADQIKLEFGISDADFDAAKSTGSDLELRNKLWDFSAEKKKNDPEYFIRTVINKINALQESVVVTDIRTQDELRAFYGVPLVRQTSAGKLFLVTKNGQYVASSGHIAGSKILESDLQDYFDTGKCQRIVNNDSGLCDFYQHLDEFFFMQDIVNLSNKLQLLNYLRQFNITRKTQQ